MAGDHSGNDALARRRPPRRGPLVWPLGTLAAPIYHLIINARNRDFNAGRGVVRFDRVVISVGNLSVGGTGKTPMVAQIVRWILEAGHRPVIAMRGYASAGGESDEAEFYRREFPDVPVVARANRTMGLIQHFGREYQAEAAALEEHDKTAGEEAIHAMEEHEVEAYLEDAGVRQTNCIVLDDGFQHRQIARDLDIVLIDATRDPFSDRLLPAGWLREPVSSLTRAGAIVLTHAESAAPADVTSIDRALAQVVGRSHGAEAVSRHEWAGLIVLEQGQEREQHVHWLAGRRALAVCAIGNPDVFIQQARRATGVPLAGEIILRDHDPYSPSTLRRVRQAAESTGAQLILTTEKDWSKLAQVPSEVWPCPVTRVRLEMRFERGGEELRQHVLAAVEAGAPE